MKKLSFVVMALAVCTSLIAQSPKFGLKGGLNLSTITNTEGDVKAGFHVGALSHIHITPAFSLQPEVMYSTQGVKSSSNSSLSLNYLNIPLLLQYNFDNGFRLQGGPQIGFLTSAKAKSGDLSVDVTDSYKDIDFSIPLGVGYLSNSGLGVDARYNIGITNVVESSSENYKNSVIQLGLFYLFDHRHKANSK
jgi:hypothetical protein